MRTTGEANKVAMVHGQAQQVSAARNSFSSRIITLLIKATLPVFIISMSLPEPLMTGAADDGCFVTITVTTSSYKPTEPRVVVITEEELGRFTTTIFIAGYHTAPEGYAVA